MMKTHMHNITANKRNIIGFRLYRRPEPHALERVRRHEKAGISGGDIGSL